MSQPDGVPDPAANAYFVRNGVLSGVLAFGIWGAFPIYFKIAAGVSALEMLAHRIVWAVPFGALIILLRRKEEYAREIAACGATDGRTRRAAGSGDRQGVPARGGGIKEIGGKQILYLRFFNIDLVL